MVAPYDFAIGSDEVVESLFDALSTTKEVDVELLVLELWFVL